MLGILYRIPVSKMHIPEALCSLSLEQRGCLKCCVNGVGFLK